MTGQEIVRRVQELDLPAGAYIVFGSGPLAATGIRESEDIDLLVTEELDAFLLGQGWRRIEKADDDRQLAFGVFDTHTNWRIGTYDPNLADLLARAFFIDGVPFGSLEDTRAWKAALGRPKDLKDIARIDIFLRSHADKKR